MNVTCAPRCTVMFCGQTALLEMMIVVDVVELLQVGVGVGEFVLLPQALATMAAARAAIVIRVVTRRLYCPDRLQKNFREMLNPRNQSLLSGPPRAICAKVVPKAFEKFS